MFPLRVLALATLFPNTAQPRHGIFLEHRLAHLSDIDGIDVRVMAPVPWFPFAHKRFGSYSAFARAPRAAVRRGLSVVHPRFPLIPKIGMSMAPFLMAAALIRPLLKMRKQGFEFDVIDAYYLYPDGVAAVILAKLLNVPVVLSALGNDVSLIPKYAMPRSMIRWAVRNADMVTTVCTALKDALVQMALPADRIRVVLHGVDQDLFHPNADRDGDRRRLGLDGPTIVSAGHLIERKRHDLAIEATAKLPGVTLLIVGDGPKEKELRDLVRNRGVEDRVRFLGHVEQADLPAIFGAVDLLVNCSDREGIANVLMEALACGTRVAATPTWGSPEVITAPEAGVLFRDNSVACIVEGIRKVLATPPNCALTRRFAERYRWSETASMHLQVLKDVMAAREVGAPRPALTV